MEQCPTGVTAMPKVKEIVERPNLPIIIFGAAHIGEIVFHACRKSGIKLACFCDDKITGSFCGLKVLHTSDLKKQYSDAVFLITSANIHDMVGRLHELGFTKWHSCGLLLKDFPLVPKYCSEGAYTQEYLEYLVSSCLLSHDAYCNPGKLFLRSVDLIITERCSLKCRDCSNLMQYFKEPKSCDLEILMKTIEAFFHYMNEIYEFRVIGGEPFMNRDFPTIVQRLTEVDKIEKVTIFTNGTIMPNENRMCCLEHEKVFLYITDYGHLSKNAHKLEKECGRKGIFYYTHKAQGWTDCSSIYKHKRSAEENSDLFKYCCAKNLSTLSDGKLYRCPFAANAGRLSAITDSPDDYIDFLAMMEANMSLTKARMLIRKFLFEKSYIPACDFCKGRPYGAPEITPAVQVNHPLPYLVACSRDALADKKY